jgi:hypothetical protein
MEKLYMIKYLLVGIFLFLMSCSSEEVKSPIEPEFTLAPGGDLVNEKNSYLDLKNGTVMEYGNRLIWQKCALGQKSDGECSGQATQFNSQDEAKKQCGALKLNGRKWKVPTRDDQERFIKSDYKNFFPNTQFSDVHCISDDINSFTDNKNGTVTDKETKLTWMKCTLGMVGYLSECVGEATRLNWEDAIKKCDSLDLAGKKWRLPKLNELQSIINNKYNYPIIDSTVFPNTISNYYWSSSTYAQNTNNAWVVLFSYGVVSYYNKPSNYYVRCVTGS